MTELWLGYAERTGRREVLMALRRIAPGSAVVFARSAQELRERFRDEEPGTVGAIVGHTEDGVSDMNLAAALVRDGLASEVVLVARGASGSLRSRASRAGIARVVDATVAPELESAMASPGELATQKQPQYAARPQRDGAVGETARQDGPSDRDAPRQTVPSPPDPMQPPAVTPTIVPQRRGDAAPILTVTSGRGGVGKTSLTSLMASVAARWGMNVAVVDLDLSCGNLYTCYGLTSIPDLMRIVTDGTPLPETMARAGVRCNDHVRLWGPCERPEMAELVMPHVATLLSYLSTQYDLVLVDTSTTFSDGVAQAVQSCDRLLVVHDERPGAVSSAARVSALAVRLGVARTRIVRVINLGDPRVKPNAFEGRGEVGLETARLHRVVDGGIEAEELFSAGKIDELASIDSDLVEGVSSMLAQTLAELGRLPDDDEARKAAEPKGRKRRLQIFGKRREAV